MGPNYEAKTFHDDKMKTKSISSVDYMEQLDEQRLQDINSRREEIMESTDPGKIWTWSGDRKYSLLYVFDPTTTKEEVKALSVKLSDAYVKEVINPAGEIMAKFCLKYGVHIISDRNSANGMTLLSYVTKAQLEDVALSSVESLGKVGE